MKRPIKQKNITRNEQFLYINSLSSEFHDRLKNYKKIPETVDDYESKMSLTEKEDRLKNQISESTKLMKLINSREMENDLNDLKETYNNPRYIQSDFNQTRYCEIGSFRVFYNKMHKDNEIFRKGGKDLQTPSFNFIRQSVKNRIVPNPIGVVRRKGENSKVDLSNRRVGDDYINTLTKSLLISEHITSLNLCKNRLSDFSLIPLFKTIQENSLLNKKLISIDLSYNKLKNEGCNVFSKYIMDPLCSLEYINLEGNNLGNNNCLLLVNKISKHLNDKLHYLNLGINLIDDSISENLADLCKNCLLLNVLILYQNNLRNIGAGNIMFELKKHNNIKILDLSWNNIGSNLSEEIPSVEELINANNNPNNKFNNAYLNELSITMKFPRYNPLNPIKKIPQVSYFTNQLCELFHNKETKLLHLDISYNNIGYLDSNAIQEHCKFNHTILGIHVDGNDMYVDELGFVFAYDKKSYKENHFANSQIFYHINENHDLIKTNVINIQKIRGKNNCWICEGWKEVKFKYTPPNNNNININDATCKVYLNFEGYKPYLMNLKKNIFVCYRMCPPGLLNFYFTMNDIPIDNYGEITHELKETIIHTQEINEDEDSENDIELKQFIITKVAQTKVEINSDVIINNKESFDYNKNIKFCIPRPEKIKKIKKRPRTPWTYPISIWAWYGYKYDGETDETINNAFEFDYNRGQYNKDKDINEEQNNELKEFLRGKYRFILEAYKNLSSYLGWKVWQIGQNQISEWASNCPNLLDSKYLINDVLVKVTEVKSNMLDKEERKKNPNVPDNIIRHQFMLLLVKIAKDKYFRTKQLPTIFESVKFSFEKHFDAYFNQFDNHKWRIERYYNEEVDNIIKAFIPLLDAVFYSNAPQKIIGKKDSHWMWLDEFTNVVSILMDSEFPVKEIPTIVSLSMRITTNEIDSDKHYNMTFPEFLEAFCRFVDKLSPAPVGENMSKEERIEQHLSVKLENLMPMVSKCIQKGEYSYVKNKFVFPQKDEETGLYIIDYDNPFYQGKLPARKQRKKRTIRTVRQTNNN